ncbi:MAG: selenocysteine-specific translation elongation factor [Caldilinea sp.]|uniref:selenocysteine-specific translation elongation factor n=1 Tax=Caldilinea sp. TaxID=2293560 RepID=UPI0030A269A6
MRVIGTAGHVDHGKSTLVHALTGIDPDRLKEEKARGMTIDLGFAWLDLPRPDGEVESVGVVDVPGHIDFIKNMLAGVGGIDAALLVVAADEGVMPQTREHLAILDLLAIPAAVVALTKIDLVDDPEWLELVMLDAAELLASTHLAGAPIVPVSAVTGAGLEKLKRTLATVLTDLPPRRNRGRPRLPIDRVFTLSGFGTVVTGTLLDGEFNVGDAVEILPARRTARIRSLQTHRRPVQTAQPGSRVAINLTGVGADELRRGDVVVHPNTLTPTTLIDVRFRLLADAPRPLRHNQTVDFFVGAAEIPGVVRLLGAETLKPGEEGWLQLRLARPAVVAAGDRFILRQPSPSQTLGGGVVLSPSPQRRWRRFDPNVLTRLQTLARGRPDEILLETLERLRLTTPKALLTHAELDAATGAAALDELRRQRALVEIAAGEESLLLSLSAWRRLADGFAARVAEHHRQFPLRRGLPRSEARSRMQALLPGVVLSVRHFNALIDALAQQGLLYADDACVRLPDFAPTPTPAQQRSIERVLAAFAASPYAPPNLQDTLRMLDENAELLEYLTDQGVLVRLGGDVLLRAEDFNAMVEEITAYLRAQGAITLAEVRDRFQTSRKYAQAVLEEMDARRLTRREGDVRVLR